MIKYKYFFGSDERSLNFLNTIYTQYNKVKVVTLEPKKTGRGRKITSNPVQIYCEQNDIEYSYYQEENIYEDMEYGIVASFAKIFTNNFISNNSPLFNIHLSLLPKYKGPTPVESALSVSYTHLRAHETLRQLVCRLLLEKNLAFENYPKKWWA